MRNFGVWKHLKKTVPVFALTAVTAATPVFAADASGQGNPANNGQSQNRYISVQLLGINDLHGQLNVTRKVNDKNVGRADYLAAYLKQREAENKNTLLVHAGDAVGASAPVSALLQDEPTIEFLNKLGFDVGTVGNHEFDEGVEEMLRLIDGGKHPSTGDFAGASFPYVAANLVYKDTGKNVLPSYVVQKVNGMPIGFIGVVLSDTPTIVVPSGVAKVNFTEEAEAINKAVAELKQQGVKAIVVLAHNPASSKADGTDANGELVDIANKVDDEVDVIFGGHNHALLNATVDGKLLVQSYSYGTAFSDVDLEIDPRTKDIVSKKAEIVTTFQDGVKPDPEIEQLIKKYEDKIAPIVNEVIGTASDKITATQNESGESALGNLIADAQRAQMNTDIALMNPGGIRADIEAGEVTWGELYTVQPFNNDLVKMTLTGEQIRQALNQQWGADKTRFLQISGLKYKWDSAKPVGSRVDEITLADGSPIDPKASYTVTVNIFLADGGDNFTVFKEGTDREVGPVDLDALVNYVKKSEQPFTAKIEGRITKR
ncbi:bifunctional metallophosphatase/5'-nucleotidase [Brevibacillus migulae]|uniref:bifunctional metallophosphatase/5'-nucleotidase n=1 Tax=Brevibacillus migulae TaxID=1644114 RepID=UPI00106E7AF1|nr:5'-nucleotidase C-terminal domain-containing protein [Brevibacillus migulae]